MVERDCSVYSLSPSTFISLNQTGEKRIGWHGRCSCNQKEKTGKSCTGSGEKGYTMDVIKKASSISRLAMPHFGVPTGVG